MKEIGQKEARRAIWEGCKLALFVYTPMCGTCAAARKMLEVAEHLLLKKQWCRATLTIFLNWYRSTGYPAFPRFLYIMVKTKILKSSTKWNL